MTIIYVTLSSRWLRSTVNGVLSVYEVPHNEAFAQSFVGVGVFS